MNKTINLTSKNKLMEYAAMLIQKADPSIEEIAGDMIPNDVKKHTHEQYADRLQNFIDATKISYIPESAMQQIL